MNYNTGNAVPSDDPRDLDDNAQALDRFCNSTASSEPDRFGVQRKTLHAIQELYGVNSTALDGLTGAADRLPYFTGPGAMALATFTAQARALLDDTSFTAMLSTLGAAARGANNDITSLAGLTTALSVAQGGTGVTSIAALITALLTGGIIESGGSAAGTGAYVKYADGTMIISKILPITAGAVTAMGSIFGNNPTPGGAFPVAFVGEIPRVQHSGTDSGGGGWTVTNVFPTLTQWGSYSTRNHLSQGSSGTIYLTATGRWK